MKSQSSQFGFTLLELLIVIAIIGLLAAVVLTQMSNARFEARATSMVVQLTQLEKAFISYNYQNNGGQWSIMPNTNHEHMTNEIIYLIDSNVHFPGLDRNIGSQPVNYSDAPYTYFYLGAAYRECLPTSGYNVNNNIGPAIKLHGNDHRLYDQIDLIIDGVVDPDCGRIKKAGGSGSFYFELTNS